ncbi:MAG TPA: hypothetical protein VF992_01910 [Thermoplasmata archaeon]
MILYASAAIALLYIVGSAIIEEGSLSVFTLVGAGLVTIVLGILVALVRITSLERIPSIENGVLRLAFPIKRTNGIFSKSVLLTEITEVEPSFGTDRTDGVEVTLIDGTEFFLPRSMFVRSGMKVLEDLSAAFGKSYREVLQAHANRGNVLLFVELRRMKGDSILLSRPVLTYSDSLIQTVSPTDVSRVRKLHTEGAPNSYEFELADGTLFLMKAEDVERFGLPTSRSWYARFGPGHSRDGGAVS